ncbi:MAG: helix-turn-helix transcriptional regulator [Verrucomicrobiota bacterium]
MIDSQLQSPVAEPAESNIWKRVNGVWEQLYGNLAFKGVSIEWHDFVLEESLAWHHSFHEGSCEICLNWSGSSLFRQSGEETPVDGRCVLGYTPVETHPRAQRLPGERHCFITLEMSREYLERTFAGSLDRLRPWMRDYLRERETGPVPIHREPMAPTVQRLFPTLRKPPVVGAALPFWYEGRILTMASLLFFEAEAQEEMFCSRQQRIARERTEAVKLLLEKRLADPPTMTELGKKIGCSAAYLGRIFAAETGMSVPQYLRKIRLQRAAELLREGSHNVTEAAFDVGYSSLSHFSKAFYEEFGCCPGLYPQGAKIFERRSRNRS